jgi:CheY-like chemotaxis protein
MTKPGQPGSPARTRILVIDDDELALQAISDVLEAAGYDVHSMVSPIGATQIIVSQGIEAAVIDLNMPVMRGDRFISLLRSWDKLRDLPTVLISGDSQRALDDISATLSGVAVVTKRRLQHSLVPTLARILPQRREREEVVPARHGTDALATYLQAMQSDARTAVSQLSLMRPTPQRSAGPLLGTLTDMEASARAAGLMPIERLIGSMHELCSACARAGRIPDEAELALVAVFEFLSRIGRDKAGIAGFSIQAGPHMHALERARAAIK